MLNSRELNRLIMTMRASGVTTLEVNGKEQSLRLELPLGDSTSSGLSGRSIGRAHAAKSPMSGAFLRRGIDDGLDSLECGMSVRAGEILGYVCHGPVRTIVNAPICGVVSDSGPANDSVLDLGDTVFKVVRAL